MASNVDDWAKLDNRRMLHAVYRVGDMDATIKYYEDHFGMKKLRYRDMPDDQYTNAFMGAHNMSVCAACRSGTAAQLRIWYCCTAVRLLRPRIVWRTLQVMRAHSRALAVLFLKHTALRDTHVDSHTLSGLARRLWRREGALCGGADEELWRRQLQYRLRLWPLCDRHRGRVQDVRRHQEGWRQGASHLWTLGQNADCVDHRCRACTARRTCQCTVSSSMQDICKPVPKCRNALLWTLSACVRLQITREPGPVKGGKTPIAFAEDPTGYKFELIQREGKSPEPFAQVRTRGCRTLPYGCRRRACLDPCVALCSRNHSHGTRI